MEDFGIFARRTLLAAAAIVAISAPGLATRAVAAETATEKANVKVVNDFIAAWNDPDKAVTFLADKASVRMVEDQPAVVGPQAVGAAFKSFMTPGTSLTVKTLSTTVHGPVVLNKRVDTMKVPGKPDQAFPVAGVFVVKDGKIVEWADYLDK
ncbi:MAG TPA: limonene-1,2-epoxide hydrolase family protein [Alphaproteobacteria bacterium]|jgi:limonene-1,2-epoxide hydrolase|nr:limonene-1,2-epoxide hydrolase family protein [Alphaproteobacteria bacterium]